MKTTSISNAEEARQLSKVYLTLRDEKISKKETRELNTVLRKVARAAKKGNLSIRYSITRGQVRISLEELGFKISFYGKYNVIYWGR